MNKIHRKNVDIAHAFNLRLVKLKNKDSIYENDQDAQLSTQSTLSILKSRVKRLVKFILKNFFRLKMLSSKTTDKSTVMQKGVVVIGTGGHAKVCIELLRAMGEQVSYCIGQASSPSYCLGVPVLKGDEQIELLRQNGYSRLFIAIGNNSIREKLAKIAINYGYELVNAISPQAILSPNVKLGHGIAIMSGVVINTDAIIADLAIINTAASIDHDCHISTAAHIAPQCALAGNVKVGSQSFLGIGSKVIPEIIIEDNVIVGAGTVVISNIKKDVTVVGVPARIISD